jgi:hypothetical protein
MNMSQTDFSTWNFSNYHVQQELTAGQFVSAETSLVASGPPQLNGGSNYSDVPVGQVGQVFPIGLIENAGISQSKQLQKLFEIGSSRSYFIPGRVIGSVSMGRIFYYGPSLLRVLYAYYYNNSNGIQIGTTPAGTTITLADGSLAQSPLNLLLDTGNTLYHQVQEDPGDDYFFINLASDLFAQPLGLAFYFKDANYNSVGAFYLENTYIQGHQFSISSGNVLIMEGISAQYDRIVPIKVINA